MRVSVWAVVVGVCFGGGFSLGRSLSPDAEMNRVKDALRDKAVQDAWCDGFEQAQMFIPNASTIQKCAERK